MGRREYIFLNHVIVIFEQPIFHSRLVLSNCRCLGHVMVILF